MIANSVKSTDKRLTDAANSSIIDISNHLELSTMRSRLSSFTSNRRIKQFTMSGAAAFPIRPGFDLTEL